MFLHTDFVHLTAIQAETADFSKQELWVVDEVVDRLAFGVGEPNVPNTLVVRLRIIIIKHPIVR
jgi:hypothetical protein